MRFVAFLSAWALAAPALAAPEVPRGRPAPRPTATHVVVRPAELEAAGVIARVAPGVAVAVAGKGRVLGGKVSVTLAGSVELAGKMAAAALGVRALGEVELRDARTKAVVGKARPGASLRVAGASGGDLVVEPVGPLHGRFAVAASAVGAGPAELVLPVPEGRLVATRARAELRAGPEPRAPVIAVLDPGARMDVVARSADGARVRGSTYGGIAIEGWLPAAAVAEDAPVAPEPVASRGLKPTHEALVDIRAFADAAGKRGVGILRGGTLLTVGVETSGNLVKAMTYGEVVVEVWIPSDPLRPLDPSIWAEGP